MTAQLRLLLSNKGVCYEIENYYLLTRSKTANEQQRHTGNINGNSRTKTEQEGTRKMTTKRMKIQTQKIVKNQGRKQDGQMEDDQQKV